MDTLHSRVNNINVAHSYNYDEQLRELILKDWSIYTCSPLFHLEFNEMKLKQYSNKMKQMLRDQMKSYPEISINFEPINILENSVDPQGFKISIVNKEKKDASLYEGHFFTYDKPAATANVSTNELYLPILLCKGLKTFIEQVHKIVSRFFDCTITRVTFNVFDMEFLLICHLSINRKISEKEETVFVYSHPVFTDDESINISVQTETLFEIWSNIHDIEKTKIEFAEVEVFFKSLNNIFSLDGLININCLVINELKTSFIKIHKNGKFKVKNTTSLHFLLQYLYKKLYLKINLTE